MELYKEKEMKLKESIDKMLAIPFVFEEYVEETENFISKLIKDTIKANELQKRIDKAIEYLESYNVDFARCEFGEAPISMRELDELLEILKGGNND